MSKLTAEGRADFARLEKTIREGLETFVEVGRALAEIKERMLYKEVCSTFESYVQIRWGFSRQHAYQQIAAAETAALLSTTVDNPPLTEGLLRPLNALPMEERVEAFEEAKEAARAEGRPRPTATHTTAAVKARKKDKAAQQTSAPPKAVAVVPSEAEQGPESETTGSPAEGVRTDAPAPDPLATGNDATQNNDNAGAVQDGLMSTHGDEGWKEGNPPAEPSPDRTSVVPPASSQGTTTIGGGAESVVLTVLAALPSILPQPTSADLASLTKEDVDRLLSAGRWAQQIAARWALLQKQTAA